MTDQTETTTETVELLEGVLVDDATPPGVKATTRRIVAALVTFLAALIIVSLTLLAWRDAETPEGLSVGLGALIPVLAAALNVRDGK